MGMMTRRNQKVRMAQKAVLAKKSVTKKEPIETKVDEVVIDNNENVVDDNNKVDNVEISFYTKTNFPH